MAFHYKYFCFDDGQNIRSKSVAFHAIALLLEIRFSERDVEVLYYEHFIFRLQRLQAQLYIFFPAKTKLG